MKVSKLKIYGLLSCQIMMLSAIDYIIHLLRQSNLCDRFPQDAIQLLSAIIDEHSQLPEDLAECLKSIVQAWPEARHDTRYQRLDEYLHRKPGL